MSLLIRRRAMGFSVRVEVWPGAGASVGVVAELVDVDAALGGGVAAGNVPSDGSWGGFGGLLEGDGASDFGIAADDGN